MRLHCCPKLYFVWLLLIFFQLSLTTVVAQAPLTWNPKVGLTLLEATKVYSQPSQDAEILAQLPFGQSLAFIATQRITGPFRVVDWHQIQLDNNITGWVNNQEVYAASPEIIPGLDYDVADLYALAGLWMRGQKDKQEAAEKLLLRLLKQYPNDYLNLPSYINGNLSGKTIEVIALNALGDLYRKKGDYAKAIENYESMLSKTQEDSLLSSVTLLALLEIYHNDLADQEKTLATGFEIIQQFPNQQVIQFEDIYWSDIEATKIMLEAIQGKTYEDYLLVCNKISSSTANNAVKIIAKNAIIQQQLKNKAFDQATTNLLALVQQYPDESRGYYKKAINFSVYALSSAVPTILSNYDDYGPALAFFNQVKNSTKEEDIRTNADLAKVILLDLGDGDLEAILAAYESLPNSYLDFDGFQEDHPNYQPKYRIPYIASFKSEQYTLLADASVKRSKNAPSSIQLPKNTVLTVLYKEKQLVKANGWIGYWAKVQLQDGTIGWMHDGVLEKVLKKPVLQTALATEQAWDRKGGNAYQTGSTKGPKIQDPSILLKLNDIGNQEVVFHDVNSDDCPDILAYSSEGLVAIDGQGERILWRFECRHGAVPIIQNNIIYIYTFIDGKGTLSALRASNGALIWSNITKDKHYGRNPPQHVVDHKAVYIGTFENGLYAFDLRTGAERWHFPLQYAIRGDLLLAENKIFFRSRADRIENDLLYAVNTTDGSLDWTFDFQTRTAGWMGLSYSKGRLFSASVNDYLYCLTAKNGKEVWKTRMFHERPRLLSFRPGVDEALIYYATPNKELFALNSDNGLIKWKYTYDHAFTSAPVITDETIYVCSMDNQIHALSKADGQLDWKLQVKPENSPNLGAIVSMQNLLFISGPEAIYVVGESPQ